MTPSHPESLSESSRDLWEAILSEYAVDDTPGLEILRASLEARDRAEAARCSIEAEGMVVRDRFGQARAHPLLSVERDARSAFLAGLRQLKLEDPPAETKRGPGRKTNHELWLEKARRANGS